MKPSDVYRIRKDFQRKLAANDPSLDLYLDQVLQIATRSLREN